MVLKNQLGQHINCAAVVRPYGANSAIKRPTSFATICVVRSSAMGLHTVLQAPIYDYF